MPSIVRSSSGGLTAGIVSDLIKQAPDVVAGEPLAPAWVMTLMVNAWGREHGVPRGAIAASADGKQVLAAGPEGILV